MKSEMFSCEKCAKVLPSDFQWSMKLVLRKISLYIIFSIMVLLFLVSCSNVNIHNLSDKNIEYSALLVRHNSAIQISTAIRRGECINVDLPRSQLQGDLYDSLVVVFDDGSRIRTGNIKIQGNDFIYVHDSSIYVNNEICQSQNK